MGYTITIFLTLVVYMEYISQQIPPWDSFDETPRIVRFFMMALGRKNAKDAVFLEGLAFFTKFSALIFFKR